MKQLIFIVSIIILVINTLQGQTNEQNTELEIVIGVQTQKYLAFKNDSKGTFMSIPKTGYLFGTNLSYKKFLWNYSTHTNNSISVQEEEAQLNGQFKLSLENHTL